LLFHRPEEPRLKKLEKELAELREYFRSLRRKFRKLQEAASSSVTPAVEDPLSCVSHLEPDNILEVVRIISVQVFTSEDLKNHSLSGKKSVKCLEQPQSALNQEKLARLQVLIRSKCPLVTTSKIFMEKIQNLQKVLRRAGK